MVPPYRSFNRIPPYILSDIGEDPRPFVRFNRLGPKRTVYRVCLREVFLLIKP